MLSAKKKHRLLLISAMVHPCLSNCAHLQKKKHINPSPPRVQAPLVWRYLATV